MHSLAFAVLLAANPRPVHVPAVAAHMPCWLVDTGMRKPQRMSAVLLGAANARVWSATRGFKQGPRLATFEAVNLPGVDRDGRGAFLRYIGHDAANKRTEVRVRLKRGKRELAESGPELSPRPW